MLFLLVEELVELLGQSLLHVSPAHSRDRDRLLAFTKRLIPDLEASPLAMQSLLQSMHPATPIQWELPLKRNHLLTCLAAVVLSVVVAERVLLLTTPILLDTALAEVNY